MTLLIARLTFRNWEFILVYIVTRISKKTKHLLRRVAVPSHLLPIIKGKLFKYRHLT